jgi:hypothetical protein
MAPRVLSRRALRDEHDRAEQTEQETAETESPEPRAKARTPRTRKPAAKPAGEKPAGEKPAGPKAPPKPRARKKAAKVPPRMFARWAVCDGGLKRVAVFEYKDRAGAEAKLAQMQDRKSGTFVLQLVKDPYDPPAV